VRAPGLGDEPSPLRTSDTHILFVWVLTCATRIGFSEKCAVLLVFLRILAVEVRNEMGFARSPRGMRGEDQRVRKAKRRLRPDPSGRVTFTPEA